MEIEARVLQTLNLENHIISTDVADFPAECQPYAEVLKGREEANMNLMGFYVVKREKLKALSDAEALDLFKKDGLELIYSHMQSLANLNHLISKKSAKLGVAS